MAQTKRPHHLVVELQTKECHRTIRSAVAGFTSAATILRRPERIGATHMLQGSIGKQAGGRKGGIMLDLALTSFGEETGREVQPTRETVTVGPVFLLAAFLDVRVLVRPVPAAPPLALSFPFRSEHA